MPSEKLIRWRFSGEGIDGTPMEPVNGRLGVRRDNAPSIRWREPADEVTVHTLAELPLDVQISDDYGDVGKRHCVSAWRSTKSTSSPNGVQTRTTKSPKTRLSLKEILPLESFELTERDYISYYAYAIDNRPWGTRRSESEIRYIDIRPLRQFFQEVDPPMNPGSGAGAVIVQLREIIRRERFLINRTRTLVREGSVDLKVIDRLVKNQSELADLTRFLAEFFISRGNDDVEALSQAEAIMLQASDSLAAAELELALMQEQDALACACRSKADA